MLANGTRCRARAYDVLTHILTPAAMHCRMAAGSHTGEAMMSISECLTFWLYAIWYQVKATYNDLPGPHWVKVALVVICLAIPGPQDEILLLAIVAGCRYYRRMRRARSAP